MFTRLEYYLIQRFVISFFKTFLTFLLLLYFVSLLDEFNLFRKNEEVSFLTYIILSIYKMPSIIFNVFPFIMLFSGIFFFLKIYNDNEIIPIRIAGFSNLKILIIPSTIAFIFGYMLIFFFSPLSSFFSKNYENLKKNFNQEQNLFFFNQTGTWLVEEKNEEKFIIRIGKFAKDLKSVEDITIFNFDKKDNFLKRYDSKTAIVEKKNLILQDVKISIETSKKKNISNLKEFKLDTSYDLSDLKKYYKSPETISFLDLKEEIKFYEKLGYNTLDLIIRYKMIFTLPIYLFSMVFLSGLMIINLQKTSNTFFYTIAGVLISVGFHFLSNFSQTLTKSEVINIDFSVWIPIFVIFLINLIGIIQVNAK